MAKLSASIVMYVHLAHSDKIDPLEMTASCWFRSEHDGIGTEISLQHGYSPGLLSGVWMMGPR